VDYQVVNKSDYENVNNLENLTNSFQTKAWSSKFRKNNFLSFEVLPLRINPNTNELEKLTRFEYKINYKFVSEKKSQQTYVTNSKMASGTWVKIKVEDSGVYKLTYEQLQEMGFSNFSSIGVFGYGGMLSKTVGQVVADDLPERPLLKVDVNSNSVFDSGDYILFYADGPHNIKFSITSLFSHEFHNYSLFSYYFVSDRGSFKAPINISSASSFDQTVTTYDDYLFLEKDSINLIKSGRTWFWREFDYYLNQDFNLNVKNVSLSDTAIVRVRLAAKSSVASSFNLSINGVNQPNIPFKSVSNSTTEVFARQNDSAKYNTFRVLPSSENFNFNLTYTKTATNSKGWLDYISVQLRRKLSLTNSGFLVFRDTKSVADGAKSKFIISGANSSSLIWDITDRFNAKQIASNIVDDKLSFIAESSELREYLVFDYTTNFASPIYSGSTDVGSVENQNLHSHQPVDLVIVSPSEFMSQANEIKDIHEQYDNMSVVIVDPEKIYNEFSSGTPDVSALRNYLKMLYDRANTNNIPENLLLLGNGSYDNISKDPQVCNYILTYESENSLAPTVSFVSDDYYVFLDDGEGGFLGIHDMDMGVGRLPIKSASEASDFANKMREYYQPVSYGNWKNNILLIADDADKGEIIHQTQTQNLATQIENDYPIFNLEKLFLDDFEQISTVEGHRYPDVNQAITDFIHNGVLTVNWIGHGNPNTWADERVLTTNMVKSWRNGPKYPIFVTATCEFAPYDNHNIVSAGEEIVLNPNGGGIALFGTTRLAFSESNAQLSYLYYKNIFKHDASGKVSTLGMSVANTKNQRGSDSNKRVFAFLGNPAMRPSVPEYQVFTTKVNGIDANVFNDTISAMETVVFEGVIKNSDNSVVENFNGSIFPVVYDKRQNYTTRGNDGSQPLEYTAQKNIIFKGNASVVNGRFRFEFIVPVDIAYFYDEGKISYYAHNNLNLEASGYDDSFIIGGSSNRAITDTEGPEIELFMNDENFISGGITDENPILLAKFFDESGINTVGSGIGHDITMIIDDKTSEAVVLNKFYESNKDDYKSGQLRYPLSNLELGPHSLKLKAWDVLNNSSEAVTDFIVANSSELFIDNLFNYPNPFSTYTEFYFDHNQPYLDLKVLIQIFTIAGNHVKTIETDMFSTGFRSQPISWDGRDEYGDKIGKGVYVYKVRVKSPNGNIIDKFEKLVILN
ncbi:MAG TPA: type IX secretion system sortase PorU, partial [Bacteroidales bacterium]|nr:type IX secretion system sortase PorU [Bacteroidales bacterium]